MLKNIDFLPPGEIRFLEPLFADFHKLKYVYFSSSDEPNRAWKNISQSLYNGIHQLVIKVPPLKDRKEDLLHQIMWAADLFSVRHGREFECLSEEFVRNSLSYSWPGNTGELLSVMQKSVLQNVPPVLGDFPSLDKERILLSVENEDPLAEAEGRVIREHLEKNNYHLTLTSHLLKITINTLKAKIKKYKIPMPAKRKKHRTGLQE